VSTFNTEDLDVTEMPIGTCLPFKPNEVPEGWIKFEGQTIKENDHPLLFERVLAIDTIWERLGGNVKNSKITFPSPSPEQVSVMAFGVSYKNQPDMVLAIKAEHI
jgi:hypothetical protein